MNNRIKNDPLLQPFQLKHLTLKNRIISTAHEPNYHNNHMPDERYQLYHVEKAKGGMALTMTAGSAIVAEDSPPAFGNLHAYRDEIIPHLKKLTQKCHQYNCAVMIQLTHLGRRSQWNHGNWLPILSASPIREPAHRAFPKEAEDWDIERIIKNYATAAQRMKEAGLDGIEIEAYGHFLDSFWSPATNKRTDIYNGNLDNRLRFAMRTLKAIRKAVGKKFIVGVRMVADEDWEKGLSKEDGINIAKKLIQSGYVDFLNIIRGHIETDAALANVIPIQGMKSAPHLDFAGDVRQQTKFPVFHAARIGDVATARHAVKEGKLDMVGMTRAHIADPHITNKIKSGNENDIRPCVGATYCLDRIYEGNEALCIHNPATGREKHIPHIIKKTRNKIKKIIIVGAGPAGLEAARVSAQRGHHTILYEAANQPGGQLQLATRLERRKELIGIIEWRMQQCQKNHVECHFNHWAEAQTLTQEKPDIIIIATGGIPQNPELDEGENLTVSSWDILSGDVKPEKNIILYDDNGQHPGMTAAEFIAQKGAKLEIITPERFFAPDVGGLNHVPYARAFQEHGVTITINTRVRAVKRNGNKLQAILASDYTKSDIDQRQTDQIIVEHGTKPLDELYFELKDKSKNRGEINYQNLIKGKKQNINTNPNGQFMLFRIGDAVASRNVHAAIYDAIRLCKNF